MMNKIERRYVPQEVRIAAETETFDVSGYAAVFGARADLHYFEEQVAPGAFDEVLNDDVRCLINHDPQYVLARSNKGEGTLKLEIDERGLKYSYKTPNRSYALDLKDAIEAGDVSQSSFAFYVKEDRWEKRDGQKDLRTITKFEKLIDVSPVTYPAYDAATVGKRSWEARQAENIGITEKNMALHEARHRITVNKCK
jgi:HK97 family phage prohead protease